MTRIVTLSQGVVLGPGEGRRIKGEGIEECAYMASDG